MNYNLDKHDIGLILDALESYKLVILESENNNIVLPWIVEDIYDLYAQLDSSLDD